MGDSAARFKVIRLGGPSYDAYLAVARGETFQVVGPLSHTQAEQLEQELGGFFAALAADPQPPEAGGEG